VVVKGTETVMSEARESDTRMDEEPSKSEREGERRREERRREIRGERGVCVAHSNVDGRGWGVEVDDESVAEEAGQGIGERWANNGKASINV
jgi:hypothetical protein